MALSAPHWIDSLGEALWAVCFCFTFLISDIPETGVNCLIKSRQEPEAQFTSVLQVPASFPYAISSRGETDVTLRQENLQKQMNTRMGNIYGPILNLPHCPSVESFTNMENIKETEQAGKKFPGISWASPRSDSSLHRQTEPE